jgi:putative CocE/NonD family hydrolase
VAYYVMGDTADAKAPGNEWRFADDWPVPAEPTSWYLHADGKLTRVKPAAAAGAAGEAGSAGYTFDPAAPCPTVGGCNLLLPAGPMNQNGIETRKDVLCFTTDPLTAPVEVTGQAKARFFVSSSAVDTDLSVRFCDVYPDGKSYLMAEGMLRLRYRGGFDKPRPLVSGEVTEVEVELWPTSVVINAGHRIRLTVTSSNFPRFDVNPGTGEPMRPGGKTVVQANRIFCSGDRPSAVVLPVVAMKG